MYLTNTAKHLWYTLQKNLYRGYMLWNYGQSLFVSRGGNIVNHWRDESILQTYFQTTVCVHNITVI